MQRAGSGGGQSKRNALNPRRANPCISIVFSEPRKTGACGAEARMHGLGTLTHGTQRILATSPLRCGLSPQRKPPRRERSPGRIAHAERRGFPTRTRPTDPTPARVPSGWRVEAGESQHAARQNRPGPMRRARGGCRMLEGGSAQHAAIGRAPLGAKRMHKGRLPFESFTYRSGPASHPARAWRPPAW